MIKLAEKYKRHSCVENKTKRKDENERGTHGGREKRPSQ
jgi:hypothetical protein